MESVAVIIPAYNESLIIRQVIADIRKSGVRNIVVVDDGSADNTSVLARKSGANVISLKENSGTGWATKVGLKHALVNNYKHIVLMDADGQHDPEYIQALLKELNNGADLVIASRYLEKTDHVTSPIRRLGTKIIAVLISKLFKVEITDPTSGFRAMNKRALDHLADHYPTIFPEPVTIIDLIKQRYVIKEISSQMKPRVRGKSSINITRALYLMIYILRKIFITKLFF